MIDPNNVWHVIPVNDLQPHNEELTYPEIGNPYSTCECHPTFQYQENEGLLVIHNSFDGRENFEPDNKVRLN